MFEYIIQKDGYKVKIIVRISCDYSKVNYRISDILTLPKGKRKWLSTAGFIIDDYSYRRLGQTHREAYVKERYLKICTIEDIENAVNAAYNKNKPSADNVMFGVY